MAKAGCCPTCGQVLPRAIPLPALTQRIYDCVAAHPHGINTRALADYVYANDPEGGPPYAEVSLRTLIWNMNRRYLKKHGLLIRGSGGPGSVYTLRVTT